MTRATRTPPLNAGQTPMPRFYAGQVVELTRRSGWGSGQPVLLQVERCRPAGTSGWGYLTGYLSGHGHTSTFFLDLRAVLPTEVH